MSQSGPPPILTSLLEFIRENRDVLSRLQVRVDHLDDAAKSRCQVFQVDLPEGADADKGYEPALPGLRDAIGRALIQGAEGEPPLQGLYQWPETVHAMQPNPNVLVNKEGEALTEDDLESLATCMWQDEYANYDEGDWWLVCHPGVHPVLEGMSTLETKIGKTFGILSDSLMKRDVVLLINFEHMGYIVGDEVTVESGAASVHVFGVLAKDPRPNIGMLFGLAG